MDKTPHELFKEKLERSVIVFLLSLAVLLFIVFTVFIFFPRIYHKPPEPHEAKTENTVTTTTTDTLYKKKSDTVYSSRKIITSTTPVSALPIPAPAYGTFKDRLDASYFYFILIFGALLLLLVFPRLISFSINKDGVTGTLSDKEKENINKGTEEANKNPQLKTGGTKGGNDNPLPYEGFKIKMFKKEEGAVENKEMNLKYEYDPQKGLWGKKAENKYRRVSAAFKLVAKSEWVQVTLTVESTSPDKQPLKDYVMFHLHPTFDKPHVKIYVIKGVATYSFYAWGAFTLGVETDFGENFLELDLAELQEAPALFKSR